MLAGVKQACQGYVEGFLSPATDLMYGRRLDGPRGPAVLESPAEIARERVRGTARPFGYGAGIEDVALQNGYLLFALCDAFETTREPYFGDLARRIFRGMRRIGTVSPVPGFVARGPHPNGKSYYRDSSVDQHSLFVCGLWRYARSPIASDAEKAFVRDALDKFARRMEKSKWVLMVEDGSRRAHAGSGNWLAKAPSQSVIVLSMLAAVADATGDPHWRREYDRLSNEQDGARWKQVGTLSTRLPRYTMFISQDSFRAVTLARIEADPARKAVALGRVRRMAADMLACNFFTHWRRLDWVGERSDDEVAAYLKPLGLALGPKATVADLWRKYDRGLRPPRLASGGFMRPYDALCICMPVMTWQMALLSRDPDLARQVHPFAREVFEKLDLRRVRSGWTYNYAVVLGLLDLAAGEIE